jgi:hypothetical protein
MEIKHTPGPWKVFHEYNVMKDNRSIANCGGHTVNTSNWQEVEEENKANARLIAAAPALLAACEAALAEMRNTDAYMESRAIAEGKHGIYNPFFVEEIRQLSAAIAAAKGKPESE